MNLFVFNDPHGYNLNLVIEHCKKSGSLANNIFINLNKKTIYKNDRTEYLDHNLLSFKKKIKTLPEIRSAIFCPLDNSSAYFLKELKRYQPGIKVKWIFWSYEYYHQPGAYEKTLTGFSLYYYKKRNTLLKKIETSLKSVIKKLILIPVYNKKLLKECYSTVNEFYSFLPQDYKNIFDKIENHRCRYYPISFLSIEQITQNIKEDRLANEIMIGHAGRLTANHVEVFEALSTIPLKNMLIPLQYGDDDYKNDIKKIASGHFGNRVIFLEDRLDMQSYFKRLSKVSHAIFNFTMQEGLGNIVFLVWNGAKVFLREESSVYKQFTIWGLKVFSVEHDLTEKQLTEPLPRKDAEHNRLVLENMFSETQVNKYWEPLFQ